MINKKLTHVQAMDLYVGMNLEWLTADEQPVITAIYAAAEQLDKRVSASLMSEYRQLVRELHRRKPGQLTKDSLDEFEQFMEDFDDDK